MCYNYGIRSRTYLIFTLDFFSILSNFRVMLLKLSSPEIDANIVSLLRGADVSS